MQEQGQKLFRYGKLFHLERAKMQAHSLSRGVVARHVQSGELLRVRPGGTRGEVLCCRLLTALPVRVCTPAVSYAHHAPLTNRICDTTHARIRVHRSAPVSVALINPPSSFS